MTNAIPANRPNRDRYGERAYAQFTGLAEGIDRIANFVRAWDDIPTEAQLLNLTRALHGAAKRTQQLLRDVRDAESR